MPTFSANLGFLWSELRLPDAIRAAKAAGFDAVECHFPYDIPPEEVSAALAETGLPMLGLNTWPGDRSNGLNGLCALPDSVDEARAAIDQAVNYAAAIGAQNVHVMAGIIRGAEAHKTFVANLRYATERARAQGITILIEPLNRYDAPGYFLSTTAQASEIIREVDAPNLKLMFDCYHVQIMEGDVSRRLANLLPLIGHIQFAGVPDRGRPDRGEVAFGHIFRVIDELGYTAPLGAEYRPNGPTEDSLGWMQSLC